MSIQMDPNLIRTFRDKVNKRAFFRQKYRNVHGKNYWNIICSAMDWISVTVEALPSIQLNPGGFGHNHRETLNLMQYIVAIDNMFESIRQLFRVLYGNDSYPLENDRSVFHQTKISDDDYFKQIRAVFATHPVNLKSVDGVTQNKKERFFASWASPSLEKDYDYIVFLYSNDPQKDQQIQFGVSIQKVNQYAQLRYNLLIQLSGKVDEIINEHVETFKALQITNHSDPIEQLKILHEENVKRFGARYGYADDIGYIHTMLSKPVQSDNDYVRSIINSYKTYQISFIETIKNGLQNMQEVNLNKKQTFIFDYEFEKIYQYLYDGYHPLGIEYFKKLVNRGFLPSIALDSNDTYVKMLILDAYLHHESEKLSRRVSYDELLNR